VTHVAPRKAQLSRVRPTRVYRFYRGGALIDRLRGEPEHDGEFPEDWVGSRVRAVSASSRRGLFAATTGEIDGQGVRPGDAFALPAAAEPFDVRGDLRVLRCLGGI
jgi:hypothetical protein